jgi:hypothetical protein
MELHGFGVGEGRRSRCAGASGGTNGAEEISWAHRATGSTGSVLSPRPILLLAAALLALDKRAEALEAEIARLKPPLHVVLGSLFPMIRQIYSGRLASWEKWEAVSDVAQGTRG